MAKDQLRLVTNEWDHAGFGCPGITSDGLCLLRLTPAFRSVNPHPTPGTLTPVHPCFLIATTHCALIAGVLRSHHQGRITAGARATKITEKPVRE
jgi:hypothetical protein